jgi:hypothetical protein
MKRVAAVLVEGGLIELGAPIQMRLRERRFAKRSGRFFSSHCPGARVAGCVCQGRSAPCALHNRAASCATA